MSERKDLELIAELVPRGARVLDLGCGSGELLAHLIEHRACSGYGIELADANVHASLARGIDAAAHRGALEAGGRTVAVMATGTDICYPQAHRGLLRNGHPGRFGGERAQGDRQRPGAPGRRRAATWHALPHAHRGPPRLRAGAQPDPRP